MGVNIAKRTYSSETRPSSVLKYLAGCIGEKITVTTEFYYENIVFATDDNHIFFAPDTKLVNTLDNLNLIKVSNGTFFNNSKVGDTIFSPTSIAIDNVQNEGSFVITEILDGGLARFNNVFVPEETTDGYIANITPFSGVKYAYNLLETGKNYNSIIDTEYQQAEIGSALASTSSDQNLIFTGRKSYQIGNVKIKGEGVLNAQQRFTITHEAVITPFFLANDYSNLLIRKRPQYFNAEKCLNYISKISISKSLNDPNGLAVIEVPDSASNTGWFNENFNGKPSKYLIDSLTIKRTIDNDPLDALIFGQDVTVEFIISNPNDSFYSGITPVIFGFNYLPENESLYQDNGFNQIRNFLFDSKKAIVGGATVNGDNNGTALQVIKNVDVDFITTKSIKVTVVINFGSDARSVMSQGDFKRYMFWVINDNTFLSDENSDKVNTLLQVSEIYVKLVDVNLIGQNTVFIQHPYTTRAFGDIVAYDMFPVDDVVSNTEFSIDYTGKEDDGIFIQNIKPRIKLKHATNADITLETFTINTSGFPLIGTLPAIQNINYSQEKVFKREEVIRKRVIAIRDYLKDAGLVYNWLLTYPFMNRWEYWESIKNIGSIPTSLFDSTKPFDGLNNFWNRLANVTGWTLNYELTFEIVQNGVLFQQAFNFPLKSRDFGSNTQWINCKIESFDTSSNTLIQNSGKSYIQGFKDSKIICTFEKASGIVPALDRVAIVIWIEPFENQGISDIRMISSVYETIPLSWFKSIDNSNKVVVSKTGSVFKGTCLIDSSKLPSDKKFTVYARIYELTGVDTFDSRITNNLIVRTTNNGDIRFYK